MPKVLKMKVREISLDLLDEPAVVARMEVDAEAVQGLAENIEAVGLLQPINVRPVKERFEIIAGHRRVLAFRLLKRKSIPAIVGDFSDVGSALARASENLGRVNLSPIEEAATYGDLHDNHGLTHDEIGHQMGKSAGVVRRRLDLLRMPPQLQKAIHLKEISCGVGEELWSIGDKEGIDYYLSFAVEHGVTVAVARAWAKDWKDTHRRAESDVDKGGGPASPFEVRPTYLPCDLCSGPEEVKDMQILHCCRSCNKKLMAVLESSQT
jgi:ParB family chromosome partitioning protein